jgi:hypothetical protein
MSNPSPETIEELVPTSKGTTLRAFDDSFDKGAACGCPEFVIVGVIAKYVWPPSAVERIPLRVEQPVLGRTHVVVEYRSQPF